MNKEAKLTDIEAALTYSYLIMGIAPKMLAPIAHATFMVKLDIVIRRLFRRRRG